jgi:FkbM family methyltransferase
MDGFLKRLLSRDRLMRMLGRLGIRAFLWRVYCQWFGPGGGILRLDLDGYHAKFYVHSQWVFTDLQSFGGERDVLAFLTAELKPGDVVYDIGANMGLHAVFLAQAAGERGMVLAFEPESHYCERLRANVALNGLKNVVIYPFALGDHSHTSDFLPSERGKAAPRLAEVRPEKAELGSLQTVRVVQGDELVHREQLRPPRLIKIDVEGYEHAVIRGLTRTLSRPACQLVCCEVHPNLLPLGLTQDSILDLLKACGFTRFDIRQRATEVHILGFKEGAEAPQR